MEQYFLYKFESLYPEILSSSSILSKPSKFKNPPETDSQRAARMKKSQSASKKVLNMVKKSITDKYGKNAIMSNKK